MYHSFRFLLIVVTLSFYQISFAQFYKIGTLDVYGNRKIAADVVLKHLDVNVGDSITHEDFKSSEKATILEKIPGVKHATVNPVCCDTSGNLMLFIGIGENDFCILKYRNAPKQNNLAA